MKQRERAVPLSTREPEEMMKSVQMTLYPTLMGASWTLLMLPL